MNPVEQLATTELAPERYHPDGLGHLQVAPVIYNIGASPRELLDLIDAQQRWPEFQTLVHRQSSAWRAELLRHLPEYSHYNDNLLRTFIACEEDEAGQLFLLEQIPHHLWSHSTAPLLSELITLARHHLSTLEPRSGDDELEQLGIELEQQMLNDLILRLDQVLGQYHGVATADRSAPAPTDPAQQR